MISDEEIKELEDSEMSYESHLLVTKLLQAYKEQREERIRFAGEALANLTFQLAQKDEVIGRLKECLRFYGNGLKAKRGIEANDNSIHPAIYDGGHKAREILKELGE